MKKMNYVYDISKIGDGIYMGKTIYFLSLTISQ